MLYPITILTIFIKEVLYLCLGEASPTKVGEPTCFQAGECTQSLFVGSWTPDDAQGCLTECQNEPECRYFTYYDNRGECTGFLNCEVFSEDSCTECYSGQQTCQGMQHL